MQVIATQFDIPRPATPTGWLVLIFLAILVALILNQGVNSVVSTMYPHIKKTLLFFLGLLVVAFIAANEAGWGQDPVARIEVLPADGSNPLSGANTQSNSGGVQPPPEQQQADDHGHYHDDN